MLRCLNITTLWDMVSAMRNYEKAMVNNGNACRDIGCIWSELEKIEKKESR